MSRYSYGAQVQYLSAWEALVTNYFDPETAQAGDRVDYRVDDDDTDDQVWDEAERDLARRGFRLVDDGNGYVVRSLERAGFTKSAEDGALVFKKSNGSPREVKLGGSGGSVTLCVDGAESTGLTTDQAQAEVEKRVKLSPGASMAETRRKLSEI